MIVVPHESKVTVTQGVKDFVGSSASTTREVRRLPLAFEACLVVSLIKCATEIEALTLRGAKSLSSKVKAANKCNCCMEYSNRIKPRILIQLQIG